MCGEGGSIGSPCKGAFTLVTMCEFVDMGGESMIVESVAAAAQGGDVNASGTLSSGACRIVVSLIWEEVGGGGRFGAFGLYFPFWLVGSSLLGTVDLGSGEL